MQICEGVVSFDDPTFLKWKAEGRLVKMPRGLRRIKTPRPDSQIRWGKSPGKNGQDVTVEMKREQKKRCGWQKKTE